MESKRVNSNKESGSSKGKGFKSKKLSKEDSKKSTERIIGFLKEHKLRYVAGVIVLTVISILQVFVPKITGNVVDYLNGSSIEIDRVLRYVLLLIVIALNLLILHYLSRQLIIRTAHLYSHTERKNIFNRIVELSMSFFTKRSTGEIMALTTNDTDAVKNMLGRGIIMLTSVITLMISSIIIISRTINIRIALLLFIPMPFMLLLMSKFGMLINKRFRLVQKSFADMTEKVQENIVGVRVIKAFTQEKNEINNFQEKNNQNYKANMNLVKVQGLFGPLIRFIMDIGQFLVILFGGRMVISGTISLGDFVALNSYVGIIMRPLHMIGNLITLSQRGMASESRILQVLKEKQEIYDGKFEDDAGEQIKSINGTVEFNDVTFRYSEELDPALKKVSFKVTKGKTIGIIGRIGSGKSTVASLLLRLYDTQNRNKVLIDDTDIASIPLNLLRNNISYVPQDNCLFSDTITNNIDFMQKKHSISEIEAAANTAQVHTTIKEFKDEYDSVLGERGMNLSGGQKQRISIARALIKDAPILILDDCLSAVDTETESKIIKNLKSTREKRACIIIAHRITAVKDADEILVMDNGEIVERGTHDKLLSLNGMYKRIYQRQIMESSLKEA